MIQAEYNIAMNDYNERTKEIGKPRLPPEKVASIIGRKRDGAVASSMIAFAKGGDILNVGLAPYFTENTFTRLDPITHEQTALTSHGYIEQAEKNYATYVDGIAQSFAYKRAMSEQVDRKAARRKIIETWFPRILMSGFIIFVACTIFDYENRGSFWLWRLLF